MNVAVITLKRTCMLIKSYGEFWNPFVVDWSAGELFGKGPTAGKDKFPYTIDFWNAKGIYVLLNDFKPVYVGQSFRGNYSIAKRLKDHLTDRFAGRWTMFSWYSVNNANKTNRKVSACQNRQLKLDVAVDTLEALSILITDPPLNRKRNRIPNAREFTQVGKLKPKTNVEYFEEILKTLP